MIHRNPLLFFAVLSIAFVFGFAFAVTIVSYNVPGKVFVTSPVLNLKLYNDADGLTMCNSLTWKVSTGELAEVQAKYLKNIGTEDLSVWYDAKFPSGMSLQVTYHAIRYVNGEWTPAEKDTHTWTEGDRITLNVDSVKVVCLYLDIGNASGGHYDFTLTFYGERLNGGE